MRAPRCSSAWCTRLSHVHILPDAIRPIQWRTLERSAPFVSGDALTPIVIFNTIVGLVFSVCFLYQVVFFFIGLIRGQVKIPPAKKQHTYAFFLSLIHI